MNPIQNTPTAELTPINGPKANPNDAKAEKKDGTVFRRLLDAMSKLDEENSTNDVEDADVIEEVDDPSDKKASDTAADAAQTNANVITGGGKNPSHGVTAAEAAVIVEKLEEPAARLIQFLESEGARVVSEAKQDPRTLTSEPHPLTAESVQVATPSQGATNTAENPIPATAAKIDNVAPSAEAPGDADLTNDRTAHASASQVVAASSEHRVVSSERFERRAERSSEAGGEASDRIEADREVDASEPLTSGTERRASEVIDARERKHSPASEFDLTRPGNTDLTTSPMSSKLPTAVIPNAGTSGAAAPQATFVTGTAQASEQLVRAQRLFEEAQQIAQRQSISTGRRFTIDLPVDRGAPIRLTITPTSEGQHRIALVASTASAKSELERHREQLEEIVQAFPVRVAELAIERSAPMRGR